MKMNCKRLSGCEFLELKTDLCTRIDYPCKNCYCVCKKYIQLCNERGEVPKKDFTYTEAMEEVCFMQQEIINELRFAGKSQANFIKTCERKVIYGQTLRNLVDITKWGFKRLSKTVSF